LLPVRLQNVTPPEKHFNVGAIEPGLPGKIVNGCNPVRIRVENLQQGIDIGVIAGPVQFQANGPRYERRSGCRHACLISPRKSPRAD
jgi:hypothetical protein